MARVSSTFDKELVTVVADLYCTHHPFVAPDQPCRICFQIRIRIRYFGCSDATQLIEGLPEHAFIKAVGITTIRKERYCQVFLRQDTQKTELTHGATIMSENLVAIVVH